MLICFVLLCTRIQKNGANKVIPPRFVLVRGPSQKEVFHILMKWKLGGLVNTISLQAVVERIFNATRHPRHMEAAAIVMYMYLYSLAFMDHP